MSEKRNSASRLAGALNEALAQQENILTADAWFRAFKRPKTNNQHLMFFFVTNRLQLLFSELNSIREHLRSNGFTVTTYEPAFQKIENAISPSVLHVGWAAVKQSLSPEVLLALSFCKDMMPNEESEISTEDLQSLIKDLESLDIALQDAEIPSHLKVIIKRYIQSIWDALDEYQIVGAKALKCANSKAIGELLEVQTEIKESNEKPVIKKFGQVFKKVNDVADAAIKVDSLMQIGHKVVDALQKLL
jgi:hypothetical protein